ncbi:Cholesterol 7-alpha-monooxygenase 1 [Colletotrichum chlorophyti]|uniref:Cholesterol 7-alpha-monooxygenase 1 n=1 Tax=Colletotrichum chlorophyti TaxID=708187 RepID=A0A1Q8S7I7_9PEZI|nr:Cholesterol 7-alpha-monooxygenase 1 [Colletotrichum chlorophyti]
MLSHVFNALTLSEAVRQRSNDLFSVLAILLLPFLLTYLSTYIRFLWQTQGPRSAECREPPRPPYMVPGLGHAYTILFNAESFLRSLQSRIHSPFVSLSIPWSSMCYVLPGKGVRSIFRGSRNLVPVPGIFDALIVFFGLTPVDYHVFDHDHISAFERASGNGFSTSHPDASRRIMEHQRKDFSTFLNGENLRLVIDRFSRNLRRHLWHRHSPPQTQQPAVLPDLYTFMRDAIFHAEVEALYGPQIFVVCPSFCEDFWKFYDAFPVVSCGSPPWMHPSQYRARDSVLEHLDSWRKWCNANPDRDDEELGNAESNPVWGTRYVRNMVRRYEELGFSDSGVSSVMLGFLFVTTANTIPAAIWMILHILLDQSLAARLRTELLPSFGFLESPIDLAALSSAPLLNSVYRETLRLHVAGTIGRKSVGTGLRLHGDSQQTLPDGSTAMSANWLGGLDESFWNTGRTLNGVAEHPVESFWAERFLEYPDDPTSGPIQKQPSQLRAQRACAHDHSASAKHSRDDSKARLTNSPALRGHFFPFGGGAWRCPGETLAKNTILVSALMVLRDLDVDILEPMDAAEARSNHRAMPFGTHAFDRAVPVQIRQRSASRKGDVAM